MSVSRNWTEVNLPGVEMSRIVESSNRGASPMKNDAKLGMLAGVLGVIVAAVLSVNTPPPSAQSRPAPAGEPKTNGPPTATAATPPAVSATAANTAALPSTPVVRTRKETDAQPTARLVGGEEEP
jgi:hypothetical protein